MDFSLDNWLSRRAFKLDNQGTDFYKSVSFWALAVLLSMDFVAAYTHYPRFRASDGTYVAGLLLACAVGAFFTYVRFRVSLKKAPLAGQADLSKIGTLASNLCGLALGAVFFAMFLG